MAKLRSAASPRPRWKRYLVDQMPFVLGGEPRDQVQAYSGWEPLLSNAPGEMFGPQYEDAELDREVADASGATVHQSGFWQMRQGAARVTFRHSAFGKLLFVMLRRADSSRCF